MKLLVYSMVYCGAALMVYNIYGFIRFAREVKGQKSWKRNNGILYIPIILLVSFLLGYLAVGILGDPDWIMAGILFGGSIFVFVMYKLLSSIVKEIIDGERLEAELSAAEESNRAKTSFLASISHEMRTPMNLILGMDAMALKDPELKPETRTQLEKIGFGAKHLLGLINNILDMNSIETGALELGREAFLLSDALEQIDAMTQMLCDDKGLTYVSSSDERLEGRYIGDEMYLKKVLMCILDNAVKYTDAPGSVHLETACVSEEGDSRTLQFTVTDTGVGISAEFLPKVFDVFSQEDASSTSRYGGSGLSLTVAKRILDLMGGTVTIESEKNVGTSVAVCVPLQWAGPAEEMPGPEEEAAGLDGRRILIAEDIPDNAEIVMDLLELEGAAVEHAKNGRLALEMFGKSPPGYYDAILMDLRMPVMDGLEATRQIRSLDRPDAKTVPIIALTANAFASDVRQTQEAGMDEHLAKPTDADKLYLTLGRQILRAQRAAEEGRE